MTDTTVTTAPKQGLWRRIVGREDYFDFIGRSRLFLIISLVVLAIVLLGGFLRGLNFSIEFTGGTSLTVTDAQNEFTVDELRDAIAGAGVEGSIVQVVDDGAGALISTPAVEKIGGDDQRAAIAAIAETTGVEVTDIAVDAVGPRWGEQITQQSLRGLLVFLVLVALYLAFRFEWRMAAASILTLIHDIVLTIGIYAIVGFPVSPASVIAFLTILGYSLYDTVIVFDRVKEDTARLTTVSTQTYGEVANEALNEVLVRSLSTSITSILPVASLLFVGSSLLGAETLQDLALALLIGMAVGTYSSIAVATPFMVWLKEKEPRWRELKERVESRRRPGDREVPATSATPATPAVASSGGGAVADPPPRKTRSKKSRAQRKR